MNESNTYTCLPENNPRLRLLLGQAGKNNLLCVGLNPSRANENHLDPTSRSIQRIAINHGFDGWLLVNLYPLRSPHPRALPLRANLQLWHQNMDFIESLLQPSEQIQNTVMLAWGNYLSGTGRTYLLRAAHKLGKMLQTCNTPVNCIGLTAAGHPIHPSPQVVNTRLGGLSKVNLQYFPLDQYLQNLPHK